LENKLKQQKYRAFVIFQENHLQLISWGKLYPNDIIGKYYFSGSLLLLKEKKLLLFKSIDKIQY